MNAYLDNSATTKVCNAACEAAIEAMQVCYGNPSSLHGMGFAAEKLVTGARKELATALSCDSEELIFTSGATESNNLAINGLIGAYPRNGKKIVTTAIEHPSVLEPCAQLQKAGYTVLRLSLDQNGQLLPQTFADAVDDDTVLVSFMLVNNEIGTLLDAEGICKAVKRKNPKTLIHIDAVQGFCKVPFSLRRVVADTVSLSGHKTYAPKGVGGLFLRKGVRLRPMTVGGGQEKNLRSGTESVPMIAAFGAAVRETYPKLSEHLKQYHNLRDYLIKQLSDLPAVQVNSKSDAVPYIINLSVKGIRSEIMLHHLERSGVYVSSGSACAKGAQSHVLFALGLKREESDSAIRVSFSPETTEAELDLLVSGLSEGIATLARQGRR